MTPMRIGELFWWRQSRFFGGERGRSRIVVSINKRLTKEARTTEYKISKKRIQADQYIKPSIPFGE